jgi:hypothetical protein
MPVRLELSCEGFETPLEAVETFVAAMTEWRNYQFDVLDPETGKVWEVRYGYEGEESTVREIADPGGWQL